MNRARVFRGGVDSVVVAIVRNKPDSKSGPVSYCHLDGLRLFDLGLTMALMFRGSSPVSAPQCARSMHGMSSGMKQPQVLSVSLECR